MEQRYKCEIKIIDEGGRSVYHCISDYHANGIMIAWREAAKQMNEKLFGEEQQQEES